MKPRHVIAVDPAEGEHLTTGLTIVEFFDAVADEDVPGGTRTDGAAVVPPEPGVRD
ncbi:hypothetical protein ACFV14_12745 [Streptomyces zaomyceticus]|uniref:hypothetical protein n=1 Tax=Streptomyces zaomyceticus TaxID=68286 RepID=UPI0036A5F699